MNDFFERKREWSKYKDFILGYYLEPYIPKVNKLNADSAVEERPDIR